MGCLKLSYRQEGTKEGSPNFSWEVYKKGESASEKCVEYYRYGFQGQFAEEDSETGWNSFELRMYDPVIGRFLVPDPMREFPSPYVGMGNDPVNLTDPTGGMTDNPFGEGCGCIDTPSGPASHVDMFTGDITFDSQFMLPEITINAFPEWKGNRLRWGEGLSPQQRAQHNDFMSGIGAMYMGVNLTLTAPFAAPVIWEGVGNLGYTAIQGTYLAGQGLGYVGAGFFYTGYRLFGNGFVRLHPRLTNPWLINPARTNLNNVGFGKGQYDAAHRATTFVRHSTISAWPYVRNWNTIYWKTPIPGHTISVNPWTRTIFHEGPVH